MLPATVGPASSLDIRKKADKRILIIFFVFAILSIVLPFALSPWFEGATLADIVSRTLGGLSLSFILAGISSYLNYRKSGLIPRRRLLKWFALLSIAISIVFSVVTTLVIWAFPEEFVMPDVTSDPLDQHLVLVFVTLFVTLVPTFFLTLLSVMIFGFGIVGVMSALERRLTPYILKVISGSSGKPKPSIMERAVRWLFDIPDVLDTRNLGLEPGQPRNQVRLGDMKWPIAWQLFFGAILAVYVSFNPFLANRSSDDLLSIFSLLTTAAILIPLLILSWFIYQRIGARILGQAKDFTLFNGIRARLFQSYFAVGTLIVIIRISISRIDLEAFVIGFSTFMVVLLTVAVTTTFLYLNNFENGLAEDIVAEFRGKGPGAPPEPPSTPDHQ